MRRGTRVGQAYVAVTADGSGINDDIVDAVDDAGPGVKKAGKEHGEDYGDEFGDSLRVKFSHVADKASDELNRRMAESGDEGGKDYGDRFEKTMKKSAKRIGNSVGKSIGKALSENLTEDIARMIDLLEDRLSSVSGNSGGRGGGISQGIGSPSGGSGNFGPPPLDQRRLEAAYRMDRQFNARNEKAKNDIIGRFVKARIRLHEKANDAIAKDDAALIKYQERLYGQLVEEQRKRDKETWRIRNTSAKAHYKFLSDLEKGRVDEQGNTIRALSALGGRNDRDLGDRVGRLFGAGSRNNFLNLFGKSLGNIVGLAGKVGGAAKSMFSTFSKGFSEAAEGASFLQKIMSGFSSSGAAAGKGLSGAFSSLAASGPGAAAGIAVVAASLAVLVSVAGALLGVLTALVATITSGLVGALAVAGAGMLAVVAAGGLLTAAFMSMTDAQSNMLKSAFKPLRAEMVGIGQLMLKDMVPAFQTWSKNLQEALLLLAPVASVMGKAFAAAGNIFTNALSGPGFQRFSQALTQELPTITTNLSSALGRFLNGLLGTFAAILPLVTRFSGYLADVALRFSKFANSTAGQNAIVDFVNRAVNSLLSLWNFVREFSGFIFDVLFSPAAQNAGNTIFDSLAKSFRKFRDNLTNGKLEKWFNDAIEFGAAFAAMWKGAFDIVAALYNSGVLQGLNVVMRAFGKILSVTAKPLGIFVDALGLMGGAAAKAANPVAMLAGVLDFLGRVTQWALNWLRQFGGLVVSIPMIGPLGSLINTLLKVGNTADWAISKLQRLLHLQGVARAAGHAGKRGKGGGSLSDLGKGLGVGGDSVGAGGFGGFGDFNIEDLIKSGNSALGATGLGGGGGGGGDGGAAKARAKAIREALKSLSKAIREGMKEIREAGDAKEAREGIRSLMNTIKDAADEANRSVKQVARAVSLLERQKKIRDNVVDRLVRGGKIGHATLTELAAARNRVAVKLEKARDKLADAIAMRDDFKNSVTDAINEFGSLMSAQAKTIDGVQQALTATDITDNLQSRLDKIRKFQDDLRLLIAQGLSNAAYKQLVDAGVEDGGAAAAALLAGGLGAITQVNDLVSQIGDAASGLGLETSNRMYQAGVDAAKGLVAGLTSLSSQLNSAATKLGLAIATALKNALGIHSPSTVLRDMMGDVGDGMVLGLGDQHRRVGVAAGRLSSQIAVSPEVAAYAARQDPKDPGASEVSGNQKDPRFRDLIVNTPTEDPEAVAMEVLNEVTGRL